MKSFSTSHITLIFVTVCLLYLIMPVSYGWACKCRVSKTVEEEFNKKGVVFLGEVVEESKTPVGRHPYKWNRSVASYIYLMKVEKSWKGDFSKWKEILSGGGGGDCGYGRLKIGQRLLVYANSYRQATSVSEDWSSPTLTVCSRTKPADAAQEDIQSLDAIIKSR